MQRPQKTQPARSGPMPPKYGSETVAEERAHLGRVKRVGNTQIVCNRPEHVVRSGQPRIGRDAEHSFGLVVIRR